LLQRKGLPTAGVLLAGGQRSNSMALVLAQIGWRVTVLQGGYKPTAYVRDQLQQHNQNLVWFTGTGKTYVLHNSVSAALKFLI